MKISALNSQNYNNNPSFGLKLSGLPNELRALLSEEDKNTIKNIEPVNVVARYYDEGNLQFLRTYRAKDFWHQDLYAIIRDKDLPFPQRLVNACKLLGWFCSSRTCNYLNMDEAEIVDINRLVNKLKSKR